MTREQVLQSVIDYADYETDATGVRCQRFITSVRRLIFMTPSHHQTGGEGGLTKDFDLATLNQNLNAALSFLATTSKYGTGANGGEEQIIMGGVFDD